VARHGEGKITGWHRGPAVGDAELQQGRCRARTSSSRRGGRGDRDPRSSERIQETADGVACPGCAPNLQEGDVAILRVAGGIAVATFLPLIADFFFATVVHQYAESRCAPRIGSADGDDSQRNGRTSAPVPKKGRRAALLIPDAGRALFSEEKALGKTWRCLLTYPAPRRRGARGQVSRPP